MVSGSVFGGGRAGSLLLQGKMGRGQSYHFARMTEVPFKEGPSMMGDPGI